MTFSKQWLLGLSLVVGATMAGGCQVSTGDGNTGGGVSGGADAGSGGSAACSSAAEVQATVFSANCGGCHGADSPAAGLDLMSANVSSRLIDATSSCDGATLVVAGDPSSSYLLQKLDGSAGCGDQMPKGGTPLSAEEFNCVSDWVAGLAPTDTGGNDDGGGNDNGGGDTPGGGDGGW